MITRSLFMKHIDPLKTKNENTYGWYETVLIVLHVLIIFIIFITIKMIRCSSNYISNSSSSIIININVLLHKIDKNIWNTNRYYNTCIKCPNQIISYIHCSCLNVLYCIQYMYLDCVLIVSLDCVSCEMQTYDYRYKLKSLSLVIATGNSMVMKSLSILRFTALSGL